MGENLNPLLNNARKIERLIAIKLKYFKIPRIPKQKIKDRVRTDFFFFLAFALICFFTSLSDYFESSASAAFCIFCIHLANKNEKKVVGIK